MSTGLRFYLCETRLGWVGFIFSDRGLKASTFFEGSHDGALRKAMELGAEAPASEEEAADLARTMQAYADGRAVAFDGAIDWSGVTPFRRQVLEETRRIPAGETRSYRWLAERAGKPQGARAVGQVMATNPLPVIIPCHRVVASDGSLGGYGGAGLPMKEALLRLEGARAEHRPQ